MDALKAEIASKRKAIQNDPVARPTKYMRRGDIERLKEEHEAKVREQQDNAKARATREEAEKKAATAKTKVCLSYFIQISQSLICDSRTGSF